MHGELAESTVHAKPETGCGRQHRRSDRGERKRRSHGRPKRSSAADRFDEIQRHQDVADLVHAARQEVIDDGGDEMSSPPRLDERREARERDEREDREDMVSPL